MFIINVFWPQIWALDKITVERVSAERSECLQRIKQCALQERLEAEKRQVKLATVSPLSQLECTLSWSQQVVTYCVIILVNDFVNRSYYALLPKNMNIHSFWTSAIECYGNCTWHIEKVTILSGVYKISVTTVFLHKIQVN